MKVLVACEYSGVVRDAFRERGHDALSCDLLPTDRPGPHHEGDVKDLIEQPWDLIIAHPPCTYLCNSGVRWLHTEVGRWKLLDEGALFFRTFLESGCKRVCVENPIMHKYARERIGDVAHDQIIQPWMFGHREKKATCLWLKGLPPLQETDNVKDETLKLPLKEQQKIWYASPSKDRWKIRSTTFQGIADAMAEQWGGYDS